MVVFHEPFSLFLIFYYELVLYVPKLFGKVNVVGVGILKALDLFPEVFHLFKTVFLNFLYVR